MFVISALTTQEIIIKIIKKKISTNLLVFRFTLEIPMIFTYISLYFFLVIQSALARNFESVSVEVVKCPDLSAPEYGLVASGEFSCHQYI